MPASGQIPLRFPETRLSFDDMTVSAANRGICKAIRNPERWPYHVFCLFGPVGSGVTTIAQAWAAERDARFLQADEFAALKPKSIEQLTDKDLAIDDVDSLKDAEALLLVLGAIKRRAHHIVLAGHSAPSQWAFRSPDLNSRLHAAPLAELPGPDEVLTRARLRRAFARSFLDLPRVVEDYLVTRIGLDYALIEAVAERLAGASGDRALTVPLARDVLGEDTIMSDMIGGRQR